MLNKYGEVKCTLCSFLGVTSHQWQPLQLKGIRDKVCQLPVQGFWFSPGTSLSSTSKTDRRCMTGILLKVALNLNQTNKLHFDFLETAFPLFLL